MPKTSTGVQGQELSRDVQRIASHTAHDHGRLGMPSKRPPFTKRDTITILFWLLIIAACVLVCFWQVNVLEAS